MDHDFDNIRRGAVIKDAGKTRVTMYLDNDVLDHFRTVATRKGHGYQTEINAVLRGCMTGEGVAETRLDQIADRLDRLEQHVGLSGASSYRLAENDKPATLTFRDPGRKAAKPVRAAKTKARKAPRR